MFKGCTDHPQAWWNRLYNGCCVYKHDNIRAKTTFGLYQFIAFKGKTNTHSVLLNCHFSIRLLLLSMIWKG